MRQISKLEVVPCMCQAVPYIGFFEGCVCNLILTVSNGCPTATTAKPPAAAKSFPLAPYSVDQLSKCGKKPIGEGMLHQGVDTLEYMDGIFFATVTNVLSAAVCHMTGWRSKACTVSEYRGLAEDCDRPTCCSGNHIFQKLSVWRFRCRHSSVRRWLLHPKFDSVL
jgi:hypothetical protein